MIIGLDFGTTNTGAACFHEGSLQLLPLDPHAPNPAVCRTAIYLTRGQEYFLGSQAVNSYFQQNIGRPTRFRKVWVGEILQVFAELPAFYRDVYVYEDEFSPGRLFLSIKTVLRNANYLGTVYQDQWFSASDLAAVFLTGMKQRIDNHLNQEVDSIVLGRPVHFSSKEDEEKVAQTRLLDAAFKAGFKKVYLEYEPVAAALAYEKSLSSPETILVFDFGGGTLDFTIMEVGTQQRQVLATGGIPVAGDVFDQRLFRVTIPRHLGEGDYFIQNGKRYPIPSHIFDLLTNPQEIISLNTPHYLEMLRSIHLGAQHKKKTDALMKIVSSNYALLLFDVIERSKRALSDALETDIQVKTNDFTIEERVTRAKFERAIHQEYEAIRQELVDTMDRSGLKTQQVDQVIRTGGSSQIPLFHQLLSDLFGSDKVKAIDTFSSVTAGLGIRARQVEDGEVEPGALSAQLWTSDLNLQSETIVGGEKSSDPEKHHAQPVNLETVRQRLQVMEGYQEGRSELPEYLAMLLFSNQLILFPCAKTGIHLSNPPFIHLNQAIIGKPNDHALMITNRYRLISHSLSGLYLAQQSSPTGVMDLINLEEDEMVMAFTSWDIQVPQKRYVALVTNTGQVRCFDAQLLAEAIRPRPYFQLEKRYTGLPAALICLDPEEVILIGTDAGRVGKAQVSQSQVIAWEALRTKNVEKVIAAASLKPAEVILAINQHGQGLLVEMGNILSDPLPVNRGFLVKRGSQIVAFSPTKLNEIGRSVLFTNFGRLLPLGSLAAHPETGSPGLIISLQPDEQVAFLASVLADLY